jgi:hypothetical protein
MKNNKRELEKVKLRIQLVDFFSMTPPLPRFLALLIVNGLILKTRLHLITATKEVTAPQH